MSVIWAGLTDSSDVDRDLAERFGATGISSDVAGNSNIRFKAALATACADWENITGRRYGRTESEIRYFNVSKIASHIYTPIYQSVSEVECFQPDGTWETVASSKYVATKLGAGRGDNDALYHKTNWVQGRYRVTAVWGESEPPDQVSWGVVKYAAYLWKTMSNPSGAGTGYDLGGGLMVEQERIPAAVYQLMMRDRLSTKTFARSN